MSRGAQFRGLGRHVRLVRTAWATNPVEKNLTIAWKGLAVGKVFFKTYAGGLRQATRRDEDVVGIHGRATNDYLRSGWRNHIRYLEFGVIICRKRLPFGWQWLREALVQAVGFNRFGAELHDAPGLRCSRPNRLRNDTRGQYKSPYVCELAFLRCVTFRHVLSLHASFPIPGGRWFQPVGPKKVYTRAAAFS